MNGLFSASNLIFLDAVHRGTPIDFLRFFRTISRLLLISYRKLKIPCLIQFFFRKPLYIYGFEILFWELRLRSRCYFSTIYTVCPF